MNQVIELIKKNRTFLAVFLFAFLIRLTANILIKGLQAPLMNDAVAYDELGRNLLNGKGYILSDIGHTAYRMPFLPILIAILYKIFGAYELVIRLFISLIDSLLAASIFLLGSNIYNKRAGIFAALLYALSPFAIGECMQISTEVVFSALLFASVAYYYFNQKKLKASHMFTVGALLGAATLTRSVGVYLFAFFIFLIFFIKKDLKKTVAYSALLFVGLLVVLSPWLIRNYAVFHGPLWSGAGTGEVLLGSYNPDVFSDPQRSGTWYFGEKTKHFPVTPDELSRDQAMKKQAILYIKENWTKIPILEINKLKYFWNFIPNLAEGFSWPNALMGFVFFGMFLPFFILGIKDIQRKDMRIIWLVILYFNAMALATYGSIRMRFPIMPYVYMISTNYMLLFLSTHIFKKSTGKGIRKK